MPVFFESSVLQVVAGNPRHRPPEVARFEKMVWQICDEYGARVYAYEIEPDSAILVVRTFGAPLAWILRDVKARYAQRVYARGVAGRSDAVFEGRYVSKVVAPMYLPHAVRRVHRAPRASGLSVDREPYPFSSESAYRGGPSIPWIDTATVLEALGRRGYVGLSGYTEFMEGAESAYVEKLFDNGWATDRRIIGDRVFAQSARQMAARPREVPGLEQLISLVAKNLEVTPAQIESSSHLGALGRALVARYATRTGAGTRTEVGRWFSLTGSALQRAIRHYENLKPDPFGKSVEQILKEIRAL